MSKILKIGHRGAMGYEPENTLKSFQKALDCNVDIIELDVFKCKTGELISFHDQKLNRTTNGKGYITKKSFEYIRSLDAGKGEKIPTIEEVLDLVDKKAMINFEIKGKKVFHSLNQLLEKYVREKGWKYEDFIISSFTRSKLKKINKSKTKARISAILGYRTISFIKYAKAIGAYSINVHKRLLHKSLIEKAHKNNLKVFVWTVNDPKEIEEIKKLNIDGIFSDFPDRI